MGLALQKRDNYVPFEDYQDNGTHGWNTGQSSIIKLIKYHKLGFNMIM